MSERRGVMRPVAADLPAILRPVVGKRGLGTAQLVAEWASVVGAELAADARPDRLTFPSGERLGGTLHLRVAPGAALELQHREPQILERINTFFGYRAVARLAFVQVPPVARRDKPPPPRRALSAAEEATLEKRLTTIEDPELKEALERLGRAVIGTR